MERRRPAGLKQYPQLIEEWHREKNGELTPEDVTPGSNKKVWWKGACGHEWMTAVKIRTGGSGCPICARTWATSENNLRAKYPELARQWHPEKNENLAPEDVTPGSTKKVWWKCEHGHEWRAAVHNRTSGTGCPYCAGKMDVTQHNVANHPKLALEWHPEKNGDLKPENVTPGSKKKVWWKGTCGHEWTAAVQERTNGAGCPICSGRRATPEVNLRTQYPDIAEEWHPEKNGELRPEQVTYGSNKKVWWKGKCGHEWNTAVTSRTRGAGCPVCAQIWATPENNLRVRFPEIAAQWHPEKNGELKPKDVTPGSAKKVWWTCKLGHEWQATVSNRSLGTGCPYCAGRKASPEHNLSNYPELAQEWHPQKNGGLTPKDVTPGSKKEVWWKGECGHEWNAAVRDRTAGAKCPICNPRGPTPENNLRARYPEIAVQWDREKNGDLKPEDFTPGSNKKVWWKGECGHEWMTSVKTRTGGSGCPICAQTWATPENNLRVRFPEISAQWHPVKNGDLKPEDVTPGSGKKVWWTCEHGHEWQATVSNRSLGRGCPYCAGRTGLLLHEVSNFGTLMREWHPVKNGDLKPEEVAAGSHKKVWWKCVHGHEWKAVVKDRVNYGTGCPYCSGQRPSLEHCLSNYPELVQEWHWEKNGFLTPEDVTPGSHRKVWWKCKNGHEWQAEAKSRTNGSGCPICAQTWATPENNLRTRFPEVAEEWHPEKNGELTPEDITPGSDKKVWWKCKHGHEWKATIHSRAAGRGCPYCAGRRASPENNLSNHPALAREWHPKRNGSLLPEHVTPGTGKEVWWQGECGHEWKAAVRDRTEGADCPICARRRATPEDNLRTRRPDIAAQWHPDKNGKLTPEDVTPVSRKLVWWMCEQGHVWQAEVLSRTYSKNGCPHCARGLPRAERRRAGTPALVQERHPQKNGDLTPEHVTRGNNNKALQKGTRGHESPIPGDSRKTTAARRATPQYNLRAQYPELAREWHPEKNGDLNPEDVTFGSKKTVWWKGTCGHEWQAQINSRTDGRGCPFCARKTATPEFNLRTKYPDIAEEWHPEKNGDLKPEHVTPGSNKTVWWMCNRGHEWQAQVNSRKKGAGCPVCTGRRAAEQNSLRARFPEIAKEWHPERSVELSPEHVAQGNRDTVSQEGAGDHESLIPGDSRKTTAARRATPEYNLRAQYPELAKEWHPTKNRDLIPENFTPGSGKFVWWKCECGHEWRAVVRDRRAGSGCPVCADRRTTLQTSFLALYPEIAQEWHPTRNGDLKPEDVTPGSNKKVWWKCECGHEWLTRVNSRTYGGSCPLCVRKRPSTRATPEYNLLIRYPELAKQWHPKRNGDLKPEDVTPGSNKKVWWKCKCRHEWQARVKARTDGSGCPICARKKATPEYNLRAQYPELAKEWHPEKNGDLNPEDVTPGSEKRIWWKCDRGHEWQAEVSDRKKGSKCPVCSGRRVAADVNLRAQYPDIAAEWHPEKNGNLRPEDVVGGSNKKVWWKGKCGHEWQAVIYSRKKGSGCPVCAGRLPTTDFNLRVLHPQIAAEWHPEKNGNLRPEDVVPGSRKTVWWKCNRGHEWQAGVRYRSNGSSCPECALLGQAPTRKVQPKISLRDSYPEIADEWHPEKNGFRTPEDVSPGSHKKVWWKCKEGHEWQAVVRARTSRGTGCPVCARGIPAPERNLAAAPTLVEVRHPGDNGEPGPEQVVQAGNNKGSPKGAGGHGSLIPGHSRKTTEERKATPAYNLRTRFPEIAKEWHPTRNGDLTPEDVAPESRRDVWWKCKRGHLWREEVLSRTKSGHGCPACTGYRLVPENNLRARHPEIAKEWHPEKNGDLNPEDFKPSSNERVWWKCECGHEWRTAVSTRTGSGTGCPVCSLRRGLIKRRLSNRRTSVRK